MSIRTNEMNGGLAEKAVVFPHNNNNNNVLDRKSTPPKLDLVGGTAEVVGGAGVSSDVGAGEATVLQRFYSGANVFVTGATGFMGKVLIEKLLRSCPDIEKIFVMVREKKGKTVEERIDDLVKSPCFDRVKKEFPSFREKLHAVTGDIGLEALGMSEADRLSLGQKVDIVFHVAATVRFDEKLNIAILDNVRGTRDVMTLCQSFSKLKAVLHVSTAYSNCPADIVDDDVFVSPLDSTKAIRIAETLDTELMEKVASTLTGQWPNSYAYTKAVSEDAVQTYGKGLPVAIFRPAIVISTRSEPMAGWIDNMYGPMGAMAGVAAGLLRTMQVDNDVEANVVPCDMVINGMIAVAWDVACNKEPASLPVYNFVCPHENRITWRNFSTSYMKHGLDFPTSRAIWYWTITMCRSRSTYLMCRFFLHLLPALLVDLCLLVTNKKPQMMPVYNKIHRFTEVIAYFATRPWRFRYGNITNLWRRLEPRDQELFSFDMGSVVWQTYIRDTVPGIRQYILKDPLETLPAARKRMKWLHLVHRTTQFLIVCFLAWLCLLMVSSLLPSYSSAPATVAQQETVQ